MMKKRIIALCSLLVLALCAVFSGCKKKDEKVYTKPEKTSEEAAETLEETETETESAAAEEIWEHCTVVTDGIGIVVEKLKRGKEVRVSDEKGAYYVVTVNGVELYVEKCFLRMNYQEEFEEFTGFGRGDADFYSDAYMQGDPVGHIVLNSEVTVIDGFGIWYYIDVNGTKGYIYQKYISKRPDQGYLYELEQDLYEDGGEIPTGAFLKRDESGLPVHSYNVYDTGITFLSGKATVLSDNVEACSGFLTSGDTYIAKRGEEYSTVIYNSIMADIPAWNLLFDGKTVEKKVVTVKKDAELYDNYRFIGNALILPEEYKAELIFGNESFSIIRLDSKLYYLDKKYIG